MRFTVVWQDDAQNDLATLWLGADDRAAVTAASHSIDRGLSEDPTNKGKDLREGLRVFNVSPLRAIYDINEADRMVNVIRVTLLSE